MLSPAVRVRGLPAPPSTAGEAVSRPSPTHRGQALPVASGSRPYVCRNALPHASLLQKRGPMGSLGWLFPPRTPLCPAPGRVPRGRKAVTSLWELEGPQSCMGEQGGRLPAGPQGGRVKPRPGWAPTVGGGPAPAAFPAHTAITPAHSLTHTPATPSTQRSPGSTSGVPSRKLLPLTDDRWRPVAL